MGKKKVKGREEEKKEKEGENLLGLPAFEELENGRLKCVETGHELPRPCQRFVCSEQALSPRLIDAALARNKPPLNMFRQDPLSRSKLICKLTGVTINKSEEHIWKHINGRRFLNMLEKGKMKSKQLVKQLNSMGRIHQRVYRSPKRCSKEKQKKQEKNISEVVTEVRNPSDRDSDSEETDFWVPPVGERWDFDDGGDRWDSGKESELETDDANEADVATEDGKEDAKDISKRTKRMSIEIGPSSFASRKKKNKTKPTW